MLCISGGNTFVPTSWSRKKNSTAVAYSSTEPEIISLAAAPRLQRIPTLNLWDHGNRQSPTMRHVSTTHRANLDRKFDRINLDSRIQIKYVNTSKQIADILTTGSFSREKWLQFDTTVQVDNTTFAQFNLFQNIFEF